MEATPVEGDMSFGRYEAFKDNNGKLTQNGFGFAWFKIVGVDGSRYSVVRSTAVSRMTVPKEQLKNDSFAPETYSMKITDHHGYALNMTTDDGTMKFYFTEKQK